MNLDDSGIKPTTRAVLVAAFRALRDANEAAQNLVGDALPGSYTGPFHQYRNTWTCNVSFDISEYHPNDICILLIPPHESYYSYNVADLNALRAMLHADRLYVSRKGRISMYYDIDPREDEDE